MSERVKPRKLYKGLGVGGFCLPEKSIYDKVTHEEMQRELRRLRQAILRLASRSHDISKDDARDIVQRKRPMTDDLTERLRNLRAWADNEATMSDTLQGPEWFQAIALLVDDALATLRQREQERDSAVTQHRTMQQQLEHRTLVLGETQRKLEAAEATVAALTAWKTEHQSVLIRIGRELLDAGYPDDGSVLEGTEWLAKQVAALTAALQYLHDWFAYGQREHQGMMAVATPRCSPSAWKEIKRITEEALAKGQPQP